MKPFAAYPLGAVGVVLATATLLAHPSSAAPTPGPSTSVGWGPGRYGTSQLSTNTAPAGTSFDASGVCMFAPGVPATQAYTAFHNNALVNPGAPPVDVNGTWPVARDGSWKATIRIPVSAPGGAYRVSVTCFAGDQAYAVQDYDFTVTAALSTPPPSSKTSSTSRAPSTSASSRVPIDHPPVTTATAPTTSAPTLPAPDATSASPISTSHSTADPPLAATGSTTTIPAAVTGAALLLAGAGAVAIGRPRRRREH